MHIKLSADSPITSIILFGDTDVRGQKIEEREVAYLQIRFDEGVIVCCDLATMQGGDGEPWEIPIPAIEGISFSSVRAPVPHYS